MTDTLKPCPNDKSVFAGECWRCWPKNCKCPPTQDEVEQIKAERYLLDRELQRENRRAREFSEMLESICNDIAWACKKRLSEGGEENLPLDMWGLSEKAKIALEVKNEARNKDRLSDFYKKLCASSLAASKSNQEES